MPIKKYLTTWSPIQGNTKLIQPPEMPQIIELLLKCQLAFAFCSIRKGDGDFDHLSAIPLHEDLKPNLISQRQEVVEPFPGFAVGRQKTPPLGL